MVLGRMFNFVEHVYTASSELHRESNRYLSSHKTNWNRFIFICFWGMLYVFRTILRSYFILYQVALVCEIRSTVTNVAHGKDFRRININIFFFLIYICENHCVYAAVWKPKKNPISTTEKTNIEYRPIAKFVSFSFFDHLNRPKQSSTKYLRVI